MGYISTTKGSYVKYDEFIKRKVVICKDEGIAIDLDEINPILKDHQKLIVQWLIRGGRRACFAAFGLGKSVIQLETVRIVRGHVVRNEQPELFDDVAKDEASD